MKKSLMIATAAIVAATGFAAVPHADAAAWSKCKSCHTFTPKSKFGPGLGEGMVDGKMEPGVFMRDAGTHPGFRYKFTKYIPAGKGWKWDEEHLRKWMCDSKDAIKTFTGNPDARTKMSPQHICDKDKQDEVLAKLKESSGYE
ncbi:MAG TPA: cytochrome C [Mariprofundaceae bacterium]|nr:cytochrome C [Mariprofundaceae bacterium]